MDEANYRERLRAVLRRSPRQRSQPTERIIFPGFADLHAFSAANPDLIRTEAGGAWCSYFQRGNWRMILPFTAAGQAAEARRLAAAVKAGAAPVVHVSEFPRLGINHAMLLYDVGDEEAAGRYRFLAYDPNDPNVPVPVTFDPTFGHFQLPPLSYYRGGSVKLYEVYGSPFR